MGQSASKGLSKVARHVPADLKRPPIPRRSVSPIENEASSAANIGDFLRGKGVGSNDARDMGQEMYLQYAQKQKQQLSRSGDSADDVTDISSKMETNPSLLKFIQDIGPAKQTIDKEFTSSRLLERKNQGELEKLEIKRTTRRERLRMPLMKDSNFTLERNTNFTMETTAPLLKSASDNDFGITSIELYDLLRQKESALGNDDDTVAAFYDKLMSTKEECQEPDSLSSSKTLSKVKTKRIQMLVSAIRVLNIPALRMDVDNNILGIYPCEVAGPETDAIPESKVVLVLNNVWNASNQVQASLNSSAAR